MTKTLRKLGVAAVALMLAVVPAAADTFTTYGSWSGAVGGPITTVTFGGVPVNSEGWTSISNGTNIGGLTFSTGLDSNISIANSTFPGFALYQVGGNTQSLTASLCPGCGDDYLEIGFGSNVLGFGMNMNVFTVPFTICLSNQQCFTIEDGGENLFFGVGDVGAFTYARVYSPFPIIGSISFVTEGGRTNTAPVPEPASLVLLGTGLIGGAAGIKRRMKKA